MTMKTKLEQGSIRLPQTERQWQLYQQLAQWAQQLERLPDAEEIRKDRKQTVPIPLLPMVF
jgi:hypothetical protein